METVSRYTDTSSASSAIEIDTDYTPAAQQRSVVAGGRSRPDLSDDALASAVYGYISAVRALGRQTISSIEIAAALGLSRDQVEGTLATLAVRGVKVVP